ncbi:sodium channel subunit beta-3 isoform X2 [Stegostoma tigrinum]|uniref:sodium channel subunit beta-3 isoform X2 n=1 Tax=Stegostoma tigrinum TaxID=3053191 RepID=UPI00202AEF61|nr:sodium channel subunit beta-3 isoform X2 [Stegostoma tigrinum]
MRFRNTFLYSVPLLVILLVRCCWLVCVEVPSDTEALHGTNMKLTCISCMKREEVNTDTMVEWTYVTNDGKEIAIYEYNGEPRELKGPYQGRILWNGSKDLQDVSITIVNVTLNDSGLYRCTIKRYFNYEIHRPSVTDVKEVQLTVHEDEMIYCYRKILKSEEAAQENATDYLAIPSGNKENQSTVPVEE